MRHASQSRRHTRQKTGLALLAGVLSLALLLFSTGASAAAGKGAPAKLCEGCYGPVVMGVQLGMDFEKARQKLAEYGRAHFSHLPNFEMRLDKESSSGEVSFDLARRGDPVGIANIGAEHNVVTQISFNPRYVFNLTDPTPASAIRAICTSGAGVPCKGWEKEKILSGAPVECYSFEDPQGKFYLQWVRPPYSEMAPYFHENPMFSIFRVEPGTAPEDTTAKR